MKIHLMDQRTEEWFATRLGKMTASEAVTIQANGKGLETYIYKIVAEKFSQNKEASYMSKDMERGVELEEQAKMTYEIEEAKVDIVGFIEQDEYSGCSPDGLVGEEGGLEIKCPNDVNFFKLIVNGESEIEPKYIWQVQMCLLVSQRKWWDLVFYNPNFEKNLLKFRIEPEMAKQEKLMIGLEKGKNLIIQLTQKYEQRSRNL